MAVDISYLLKVNYGNEKRATTDLTEWLILSIKKIRILENRLSK